MVPYACVSAVLTLGSAALWPGAAHALGAFALGGTAAMALLLLWVYKPAFDLPGRRGRCVVRGVRGGQRVAFTFDDGPNGGTTEAVLAVLRRHGARATFFCVGSRAAEQPALLRRMASEGHVIGNHSQDHPRLAWLGRAAIVRQVDAAQEAIRGAGAPTPTLFRAPYGTKSPLLPGVLRARGLRLCAWSCCSADFRRRGVEAIIRRARRRLRDGEILLFHDGGGDRAQTVAALDELLTECRRRGLRAVTVPEILSPP